MPPFEIREKPAPEVWLEDSTWVDTRRSRSRDDAPVDPVVITVSHGDDLPDLAGDSPPFYDHSAASAAEIAEAAEAAKGPSPSSRAPFTPAEPAGEVPGLLRRPLVEVQRTLPRGRDVDRPRVRHPDRIALLAVVLALVTLISAIITAQG